ncbi:store-operated calcium entry regulator STIMATE [Hydra vulgaris]|uniref:Store-operated calcium entry regulator STIMATE n=1 Tax=Hydra vulgaris TaxID=6087 RepID=A0ABM4C5W6_HYDVU
MVNISRANEEKTVCSLSNQFGIEVQALLAFTAFCILILKRYREPVAERRSLQIWFCDTSKQAIGAMLIHFANVFLAELSHEQDPCTLYFINFLLDTTVGLLVIWLFLKLLEYVAMKRGWVRLRMGEYGRPVEFMTWMYQCIVYVFVMFIEKVVIILLFQFNFWTTVKKFILKPISAYPRFEVVLVVLIVPFFMNALMFWVIDNFLMRKHLRMNYKDKDLEPVLFKGGSSKHYSHEGEVSLQLLSNDSMDSDDISNNDVECRFKNAGKTIVKSRRQ